MARSTFTLSIPSGTVVLGEQGTITLKASAVVDGATRERDGSYRYLVGGHQYIASAGTVTAVRA